MGNPAINQYKFLKNYKNLWKKQINLDEIKELIHREPFLYIDKLANIKILQGHRHQNF